MSEPEIVKDLDTFLEQLVAHAQFSGAVLVARNGMPLFKQAYGFFDETINGHRVVGHSGGAPGINSRLQMYLDLGHTVAVLSNYDPPAATQVTDRLSDILR